MISKSSVSSPVASEQSSRKTSFKTPRLVSLLHQIQRAKDADGKPIPLFDEILFFLDDPPAGTTDRWQKGADLCQEHGIKTSRVSVWRLYRAHILQWRREQNPPPPAPPPSPEEIARLHDLACYIAAQRVLDALNDPRLSAGHLVGLLQNDNQRRQIELARDQFNDRITVRGQLQQLQYFKRIDDEARAKVMADRTELFRKILAAPKPHSTSFHPVAEHSHTPRAPDAGLYPDQKRNFCYY